MARIHELVDLLKQAPDEVFVQPHNVPDPDAIASSFGLSQLLARLGVPNVIVYEDEIEKANSLSMLRAFGIEMRHSAEVHTLGAEDWTVLVDVQKENSNRTNLVTDEVACIDHHQYNGFKGYRFEDVRPEVGSCSANAGALVRAIVDGYGIDTFTRVRAVSFVESAAPQE